jgi:hypothetical protein
MEHEYLSNPAIEICLDYIDPGSEEKEVQALWENMIWTVFPARDHWMNQTKYKQGLTEPDYKVMKLVPSTTGWAPIDVLIIELKRVRENASLHTFNRVCSDLLDDHIAESTNPDGTTLFGAVGIGKHVQFYQRVLPRGELQSTHTKPLHLEYDVATVQQYFDHFKRNIPQSYTRTLQAPLAANSSAGSFTQVGVSSSYSSVEPIPDVSTESEAYGSSSFAGASQNQPPEQYYYVQDSNYFLYDQGSHIPQPGRPKNVWVLNENGWSDTGRTKQWRFWDGKNIRYE